MGPKRFLQVLQIETNMSMDEMNDGFEVWKQQLDSMNEINMALGIKKLNLEKVFKNDSLKKKM